MMDNGSSQNSSSNVVGLPELYITATAASASDATSSAVSAARRRKRA